MPVRLMVVHLGLATVLCLLFSPLFLSVSRLCLRIVSLFFSFLPIPVLPSDRPPAGWLHSTTYLSARLSAAMAALALAAIEAAMSGVLAWTSDFA
jgi:hypothetical protein